jgi:DNA polymerase elongation subunit (family B)
MDFRLFDYNFKDVDDESINNIYTDRKRFVIQCFGKNEKNETASINIHNFLPFFYVKIPNHWSGKSKKTKFLEHLKDVLPKYYKNSIVYNECKFIKRKNLYGFDKERSHKFILLKFRNTRALWKVKNLWYDKLEIEHNGFSQYKLKDGYVFCKEKLYLYESNIPPLLRFFHIHNINPAGWVKIYGNNDDYNPTTCDYHFNIEPDEIEPITNKETSVPLKIMSFDIEADSSHGDFPLPIKSYKKLATNIVDYFKNNKTTKDCLKPLLKKIILTAFGYDYMCDIDIVYTKKEKPDVEELEIFISRWFTITIKEAFSQIDMDDQSLELNFENMVNQNLVDNNEEETSDNLTLKKLNREISILELLTNNRIKYQTKIVELKCTLDAIFPKLQGDKITFIGSTFVRLGEKKPYLNNCLVLDTCDEIENIEVESFDTEKKLLIAWKQLVQKENPDIIIGYNIFGFDENYIFQRAKENNCLNELCQLSKNIDEMSIMTDWKTQTKKLKESSLAIASGVHELNYFPIVGRIQIDLYNVFRRDFNLPSYKLDYVSGYFIGDSISKIENNIIYSENLTGLSNEAFIHIEVISHSSEYLNNGEKFKIISIDTEHSLFKINKQLELDFSKLKYKWCLAKDDITPQDIFNLTRKGPSERALVAKYCIQDCNLVHQLFQKLDLFTGFIEMSKICSVPINYLIFRGQGIKLTSFIAKKCMEKKTLMPTIEKDQSEDGYEGAIVLEPKCNLYLDNPVACVDYSSLYPSCMISENLCHSSKVWTKEYDLDNVLIRETGTKDDEGVYIYDNLEEYKYVDITYDTYTYVRKTPKSAAVKVKTGYKICRFAQYPDERKAIMPYVLQELLTQRSQTKELKAKETDPFMKNILDKRQLSIKLTANSLYGQCGAKTSSFYEKDVAASCTATGRKLLLFAKQIIENVYCGKECETKNHGKVMTNAEYIYGDTDSVFFTFNLTDMEKNKIIGKKALEITIELAQKAGKLVTQFLKMPHDLEYEKTFQPFALLSKKRYVGLLHEFNIFENERKEMGIVLKRRDNADIVKDVYGGAIDILMKDKDIDKCIRFIESKLLEIKNKEVPVEKLIVSKSLRSNYKNPDQIAHAKLAKRIGERDPGNKPKSGDRIQYIYIKNENKKALQGDRIETPEFIKENNLEIDYSHYISHQIMKPVSQLLALVLEKIPEFNKDKGELTRSKRLKTKIEEYKEKQSDFSKINKKIEELRCKEIKEIIFNKYL